MALAKERKSSWQVQETPRQRSEVTATNNGVTSRATHVRQVLHIESRRVAVPTR